MAASEQAEAPMVLEQGSSGKQFKAVANYRVVVGT